MHANSIRIGTSMCLHCCCDALAPSRCREAGASLVVVDGDGAAEMVEAEEVAVGNGGGASWTDDGVWKVEMRLVAIVERTAVEF